MTDSKFDNGLYVSLKNVINKAIPMEYGIRAARLSNPAEFEGLISINDKIRQGWRDLGLTDNQIDEESLVDDVWDMIQVGFPLSRRHSQFYINPVFAKLVNDGAYQIYEMYNKEAHLYQFPATKYFRICDLLNGNDVLKMLKETARCLKNAQTHAGPNAKLDKLVQDIREPIPLHPGIRYTFGTHEQEDQKTREFGIAVDIDMDVSVQDLKSTFREFLYKYASTIYFRKNRINLTAHQLICEFFNDEMYGRETEHIITRLDGFMSILSGIYCWDQFQTNKKNGKKAPLEIAISSTQEIYPQEIRSVGNDAIRKNYYGARKSINDLVLHYSNFGLRSRRSKS